MSEKPIIFSGPMIKAILEDRKTQTRRIIKPQPESNINPIYLPDLGVWQWATLEDRRRCPYGVVGNRLWVRETWFDNCFRLDKSDHRTHDEEGFPLIIYRADCDQDFDGETVEREGGGWKPSIHMPRWASRITLEITCVRVERLQEISEEDAKAEGASCTRWFQPVGKAEECGVTLGAEGDKWNPTWDRIYYRNGFANVWESIHGPDSWQASPWVWVLEFRRVI